MPKERRERRLSIEILHCGDDLSNNSRKSRPISRNSRDATSETNNVQPAVLFHVQAIGVNGGWRGKDDAAIARNAWAGRKEGWPCRDRTRYTPGNWITIESRAQANIETRRMILCQTI
jgi:heme A synthase